MAFWSMTSSLSMAGATEKVLSKESFELKELLDCEDILSQVLAPNDKVISFLTQDENIKELVKLATAPPPLQPLNETMDTSDVSDGDEESNASQDESDEEVNAVEKQIRHSKISAEILTTDVWSLLDALLSNDQAMFDLWSMLDTADAQTQQLNLFTKIVEGLLEKRLDRMLSFIRTLPHFVDYFIRYIECQPLVDFLIKVISTDHPESPTDIIDFLYDQHLIPKMIDLLKPDSPHSAQSAAGDFLKAFVNISGGNKSDMCAIGPNELSRQFVSEKCMRQLIDIMLLGGHGMCVAVTVIIEVIRKNNSDYDLVEVMDTTLQSHPPDPRDNIYLGTMVRLFAEAIPKFQEMFTKPEVKMFKMPFGEVKPLGFERFRICELYAELLHCSNMNLLNDPKGEAVILERDHERNRVYYPERLLKNEAFGESTLEEITSPIASEDESEFDGTGSKSPLSSTANAPHQSPPSSPPVHSDGEDDDDDDNDNQNYDDSPTSTPSPTTPELGEDNFVNENDRQKVNVSQFRGQQLEEQLEREMKSLRKHKVIGDQLKIALDDNHCIDTVLNMLFEFPWNNFLHNVVFDIVQQVFNGYIDRSYNKFLAINLLTRAKLTERIVYGQKANEEYEAEHNIRLGYVGHLTLISEEVVKFESVFIPESVSPKLTAELNNEGWLHYSQNDLLHLREQYNTVLGKVSMMSDDDVGYDQNDDDDDDDDEDDDEDEEGEQRVMSMDLDLIDDEELPVSRMRHHTESDSDSESSSDDAAEETSGNETTDTKEKPSKPTPTTTNTPAQGEDKPADTEKSKDKNSTHDFSQYMSQELQSDQYESGSSEEDDEWVPVKSEPALLTPDTSKKGDKPASPKK